MSLAVDFGKRLDWRRERRSADVFRSPLESDAVGLRATQRAAVRIISAREKGKLETVNRGGGS